MTFDLTLTRLLTFDLFKENFKTALEPSHEELKIATSLLILVQKLDGGGGALCLSLTTERWLETPAQHGLLSDK